MNIYSSLKSSVHERLLVFYGKINRKTIEGGKIMTQNMDLFEQNKLFVLGRPIVSIFHNNQNMYSIVRIKIQETNVAFDEKELIVVGYFPPLQNDELYRFTGQLRQHPKYGQQFAADTFTKEVPATEQGVVHYLSSDLFTGIGRKTAELIVEKLGVNAITRILEDPYALDEVPRLSQEKKNMLRETIEQNLGLERVMIQLNEWGFGPQLGMKIYQTYREQTIELLNENPYRLIEDVEGVGFFKADELGAKLGITGTHKDRVAAGILHVLTNGALSEGHVYLDAEHILPTVKSMLEQSQREEITYDLITQVLIEMREESKICGEETRAYLPSLYFSEVGIASKIITLLEKNKEHSTFPTDAIRHAIGDIEELNGVTYAPTQVQAIETALNSSVMILTGGPGTGKTTVIRGLVNVYAELHGLSLDPQYYAQKEEPFPITLVAPTGRAAKRLAESTELPAMTIHRLLGFTGQEKDEETEREIGGRLLIIDEMSMVDTWLAHQLLKALSEDVQVVFVGDQDQLPPVGPGQVLKDLLASNEVPTVELTDVYRQAEGSTIIEIAHQIKQNKIPDNLTAKTSDRSFIQAGVNQVASAVTQVVQSALKKGYSIRDVQVLAPMYKGPAGIDMLNKEIQALVNPNDDGKRRELAFGDTIFRVGDKVLQLVNQPESNVFNGDMGEIISIIKANETVEKQDTMIVSYDGIEVTYQRGDLNQITLAYCCSIHKSQGSEFAMVIMPVVRGYAKMLRRNLLYTGITRAKNFLILCGEPDVLIQGLQRTDDLQRLTTLRARLHASDLTEVAYEQADDQTTVVKEEVIPLETIKHELPQHLSVETLPHIHPMIGMEHISPYDFLNDKD